MELTNYRFLTSGCSFSAEDYSWPSLLPNYFNLAEHGAGNLYIRRQIQKEIIERPNEYDFVIVQWSTIDRWDYPFQVLSETDTPLIEMGYKLESEGIENKVAYHRMGTKVDKKSEPFYKNYYSIYGQLLQTLEDIYFLQLFLEKQNIPYLMFTISNLLTTDVSFNMIKNIDKIKGNLIEQRTSNLNIEKVFKTFHSADSLNFIKNKIDWSKFIWSTDFKIGSFGDGFTEYLISKGQKFGTDDNHPDKNQNKLFFDEKIKPRIIEELNNDT